jgi:hypothetical protein
LSIASTGISTSSYEYHWYIDGRDTIEKLEAVLFQDAAYVRVLGQRGGGRDVEDAVPARGVVEAARRQRHTPGSRQ